MNLVPPRAARGFGAAAVTPHELSTQAAMEIMGIGGTAVDGAIAANAVQGVVAPETCGIGGDLFALVHSPGDDAPTCLNSSGRAGSGASAQALRDAGHETMPLFGAESITVPGCIDGWLALHNRYGRLSLQRIIEPALSLASNGFPASTELSRAWTHHAEKLQSQPSASSMFPDGSPPVRGQKITRPMLAETLESVLDGRDAFYIDRMAGPVAEATDGLLNADDMSVDQAEWVEPLPLELFGRTAWTVPPNSQGYLTLATLAVFSMIDPPTDPDDPAYTHALIEAYRSVVVDRDAVTTDPLTAPVPPTELVGMDRISSAANAIDPHQAGRFAAQPLGAGGTAYLCTVDAEGMGVSFIQSNFHGIGSGLSAGETGVWLHNRGGGFTLDPGHPNELMPGRRPLHTLSPTIWTSNGDLDLVLGTRGGHHQPQLLAQLAAHLFHADLSPMDAQTRPRWVIDRIGEPDSYVQIEQRLEGQSPELERRGHSVDVAGDWLGGWGPISAIDVSENGLREAAADPRVDTALALAN